MGHYSLITEGHLPRKMALQCLETLSKSDANSLSLAVQWVSDSTIKLSMIDCVDDFTRYAKEKGRDLYNAPELLQSLFALEGLRASLKWSGAKLVEFLIKDATGDNFQLSESEHSALVESLTTFFDNREKLDRTIKAQRIYDGLIPNYQTCASLVEFRPVFDGARDKIVSGLVVASLSLTLRSTDSGDEVISFQLDASDIKSLLSELEQLKQKIAALTQFMPSDAVLLNPSNSIVSQ